ncbi:LSU m3Psi1915 methyltransferase RlmH [hydrothermal vent metagenome]|uniref:LSU m3Psi1915 methyltransferase RlmH n=1 Tax=hydrothermal vent metagenome TaxID=652676 RepID=A0A1W1BPY6_9ZZZZ
MNVEIISIAKREKSIYDPLYKEFTKMIGRYAKVKDTELFPKEVAKAHTISPQASQKAYTNVLTPHLGGGFCITLDPNGKIIDSYEFSKLLDGKISLKFFIGGAYGFDEEFLKRSDKVISLGKLTMSHKVAKVVLLEQIYRGLSILNNHPYHK